MSGNKPVHIIHKNPDKLKPVQLYVVSFMGIQSLYRLITLNWHPKEVTKLVLQLQLSFQAQMLSSVHS
ncbi:hypothetical protein PsorP6_014983 [Peronosclerospora sorghi]|uniref:Uncharacterized protein n=1 Tax=Peronosclerospora sorghi TaxID=230839 RepID=A0ACC0VTL3_9STRA|nr:hypothetical protein PsorP6_014983 [Peronosclerospora sorghi]